MSKNESDITDNISIDQQLIEEGTTQLNSEIQVLETWLRELDATDVNDVNDVYDVDDVGRPSISKHVGHAM